ARSSPVLSLLMRRPPPRSPSPYATLFRSRAVIGDADAPSPAAIRRNVDMRRACIDGVLDELLHNAGRPLDDLAGGNPVDNGFWQDRKSTRLNSSHVKISYDVFCLQKNISR